MRSHGVEAEIIAADLSLGERKHLRRKKSFRKPIVETIDAVPFHWIYAREYNTNNWRRVASMFDFSWNAYRYMLSLPTPDAIIGSSPHLFAALAAQRTAKRRRVPFLFEIRDIWPQTLVDMTGSVSVAAKMMGRIANHLYRSADCLVTLAEGTGDHLRELGYPADKIQYVPNGVDVANFPTMSLSERHKTRRKYNLPSDSRLFVYAGAHGQANGLNVALDAASMLRDEPRIGIVLVGDGVEKQQLRSKAAIEGLTNVHFLSPVPKNEIPQLLGAMDVGLLILRDIEVFRYGISPNKLFDYWAARLPAIATTPGEIAGLIMDSQGGIVTPPEDPVRLAQAIRFYQANHDNQIRDGLAGREFVSTHFSRNILAERLAVTLHKTVHEASRAIGSMPNSGRQ